MANDRSERESSEQSNDSEWGDIELPVFSSTQVAPTQDNSHIEVNWDEDSDEERESDNSDSPDSHQPNDQDNGGVDQDSESKESTPESKESTPEPKEPTPTPEPKEPTPIPEPASRPRHTMRRNRGEELSQEIASSQDFSLSRRQSRRHEVEESPEPDGASQIKGGGRKKKAKDATAEKPTKSPLVLRLETSFGEAEASDHDAKPLTDMDQELGTHTVSNKSPEKKKAAEPVVEAVASQKSSRKRRLAPVIDDGPLSEPRKKKKTASAKEPADESMEMGDALDQVAPMADEANDPMAVDEDNNSILSEPSPAASFHTPREISPVEEPIVPVSLSQKPPRRTPKAKPSFYDTQSERKRRSANAKKIIPESPKISTTEQPDEQPSFEQLGAPSISRTKTKTPKAQTRPRAASSTSKRGVSPQDAPSLAYRQGALSNSEHEALDNAAEAFREAHGVSESVFNNMVQETLPTNYCRDDDAKSKQDRDLNLRLDMWDALCAALPDRPRSKTTQVARKKFHNFVARGTWTEAQDNELVEAYNASPGQWRTIADAINRHQSDVRDRWRHRHAAGEETLVFFWYDEEEIELIVRYMDAVEYVKQHPENPDGSPARPDWGIITQSMSFPVNRPTCQRHMKSIGLEELIMEKEELDCLQPDGPCWTLEKARRHIAAMPDQDIVALVLDIRDNHRTVGSDDHMPWNEIGRKLFQDRWSVTALQLLWWRLRQSTRESPHKPCTLARLLYQTRQKNGQFEPRELNIDEETEFLGTLRNVKATLSRKGLRGAGDAANVLRRPLFGPITAPLQPVVGNVAGPRRTAWRWRPDEHDEEWYAKAVSGKKEAGSRGQSRLVTSSPPRVAASSSLRKAATKRSLSQRVATQPVQDETLVVEDIEDSEREDSMVTGTTRKRAGAVYGKGKKTPRAVSGHKTRAQEGDVETDTPTAGPARRMHARKANLPIEDAPAEDAPVGDAPVGDAPVEDAPVGDTPTEDAPVKDVHEETRLGAEPAPVSTQTPKRTLKGRAAKVTRSPSKKSPSKKTPAKKTPAKKTPARHAAKLNLSKETVTRDEDDGDDLQDDEPSVMVKQEVEESNGEDRFSTPTSRPRSINGLGSTPFKPTETPSGTQAPLPEALENAPENESKNVDGDENPTPPSSQPRVPLSQQLSPSQSLRHPWQHDITVGSQNTLPIYESDATTTAPSPPRPPLFQLRPPQFSHKRGIGLLQSAPPLTTRRGGAKTLGKKSAAGAAAFALKRARKPMEDIETTQPEPELVAVTTTDSSDDDTEMIDIPGRVTRTIRGW